MCLTSPRLTWRTAECARLVSLRVNILGQRRASLVREAVGGLSLQQSQASLDVNIRRVKVSSPSVCIQGVACLIVARLIQRTKIIPDLGNVGVEANGTRVCIKRVTVLIDLVIQHTNRAPECRIATITVHSLLVGFVSLRVLLLRHVASAKQVPALRVVLI